MGTTIEANPTPTPIINLPVTNNEYVFAIDNIIAPPKNINAENIDVIHLPTQSDKYPSKSIGVNF